MKAIRLDMFASKRTGFHFHIYLGNSVFGYSIFGFWWCRGCDCGVNFGRHAFYHRLGKFQVRS